MRVAILTISDMGYRGERRDESGDTIQESIRDLNHKVVDYEILPDEKDMIAAKLIEWSDGGNVDLVFTSGGTGLGPRDVTPEATLAVVDRLVPGMAEVMRSHSIIRTPRGMLSRGVAGIRKRCLIVNLPGSPKAVRECLEAIILALPHAVEVLRGEVKECAIDGGGA